MKKLLKIYSLLLVVAILISTTAFAEKNTAFTDVNASDYFYPAVQWGVESGITYGVNEEHFAPEGEVTRAQVVTFLWRMAGQPEPAATETFSDVEAGSWYETAVKWAVENEITEGTGDNMFSPDVICNRAMCITLLYRLMGSPFDAADKLESVDEELSMENMTMEEFSNSVTKSFIDSLRENGTILDVNSDDYYELAVFWATINGIIDENTVSISEEGIRFSPNDACVRKEMISFLYKTKLLEDAANAPVEIYFGEDLALPIPQEYYNNETLAMEVYGLYDEDEDYSDEEDEDELAVIVSENASKEASEALGEDTEGQGELFRIIRVSEDRLHELLCGDMSGMNVFAMDKKDRYYIICYPTDVRYVRETTDKMNEDIEAWTEVNEWAR
ncbi:MAG: S-layer homology domain-containing protein, partial [Clostridia bacterium]|nr:S-layer homology domain-containing protein [Clostridia bacterium]